MKKVMTLLCLSTWLFGFSIETLQSKFYNNVIEKNIYKNHFQSFLQKECSITDEFCIDKTIERLKTWESTQDNRFLQYRLNERSQEILLTPLQVQKIKSKIQTMVESKNITTSQYITFVNLQLQRLSVIFYEAQTKEVTIIGTDLISTGNMEKEKEVKWGEDHFLKTPSGVFKNLKGWRSNGEFNPVKKTLGYGQKDRFVFYFGRQPSVRYNTFDAHKNKIANPLDYKLIKDDLEFAMHSHESTKKMGQPHSHGCIRITHELNLFLDEELVLHANNLNNGRWTNLSKAPKNYQEKSYTGQYLLVVDKI